MAPRTSNNPIAFTPLPVTIITTIVYAVLIVALLVTHHVVPAAPKSPTPVKGINITEAWGDLQELTNGFHPYNSRRNDEVRDWLLLRIGNILDSNKIQHSTVSTVQTRNRFNSWNTTSHTPVIIFDDMTSNLMFSSASANESVYFEGTNIIVYIRGTDDGDDDWWESRSPKTARTYTGKGGVMVNAHYDSVSTGLGATDDGVGVITVLQLIKYFTTEGHRPKRGIVALLNNGEEDFLNGARAFSQHPMSQFPRTFLNLEGAGAGGRATLFRSTDAEVTQFYKRASYPFGTVISADGFERGLIRSQTDYVVFNGELGLRGLDVAFMEPRARYHTSEDATRHTSKDSLWHMLSGALATMEGLSSDTSSTFVGRADADGKTTSGHGSKGVWFDLFGRAFALMRLSTLFALSITLLVVTPLVLLLLHVTLLHLDKWYLLSRKKYVHSSDDDEPIPLYGWSGFFRFPVAFIVSTGVVVALALLLSKANPYIIYSSEYAVWSMMLCAWLPIMWFLLQSANYIRESALQRAYILLWLYSAGWLATVAVTVGEDRFQIGGGYFLVIYFAAISAALLVSYLEFFSLPRKADYVHEQGPNASRATHSPASPRSASLASRRVRGNSRDERLTDGDGEQHDAAVDDDESTSLLRGEQQSSFARYGRPRRPIGGTQGAEDDTDPPPPYDAVFGNEQAWSGGLPRWIWLIQFLLFAPIVIIVVGQIGLLLTSALAQTPADGSPVLFIYLCIAALSTLLLVPLSPFLHRFTCHLPAFLFLIFTGTLIYNLLAFPFSPNNGLKVYFQQQIYLDTGINRVSLTGLDPYVRRIIADIPSAAGQHIDCSDPDYVARSGLTKCMWEGPAPHVVPSGSGSNSSHVLAEKVDYRSWLTYNVSRPSPDKNEATFTLVGRNTRACKLVFTNKRIADFNVTGATSDPRYARVGEPGSKEIRLWRREWEKPWTVDVSWDGDGGRSGSGKGGGDRHGKEEGKGSPLEGHVVCLWSDDNETGVIPALDEVRRFMPVWSAVTKLGDGLVEGRKRFRI